MNINLLPAWNITTGDRRVKVALLDVGVDLDHADLQANLLEGYDAVIDDIATYATNGNIENSRDVHGTWCAGVIGAENNNICVVGVSNTSKIIPVRVGYTAKINTKDINPPGGTYWEERIRTSWFINGLFHACYEDTVDIVNCSLSFGGGTDALEQAIEDVTVNGRMGKGCVVVVGSGNTYKQPTSILRDTLHALAKYSNVIAVGSITRCGKRVEYGCFCGDTSNYNSCYGDSLDVMAPGIGIPTTSIYDNCIDFFRGTSSATPHVAGVAALVLSVNPCLTSEEVKYVIESTCTKIRPDLYSYATNPDHPNGTWNIEVGYGLVNAYEAVLKAQQMGGYTYIRDSIVTGNVTWTGNKLIHDSLVIDSLATLTVVDTVYMSSTARLIVRPGGKLVVDGSTITSACDDVMWQGIEVVGDRTKRQIPQWQGKVELLNGATIENALCGIRTGLRGDTTFATAGGIILADSAYFTNNRRAVEINSYAYTTPSGGIANYVSSFKNCTFTVDDNNLLAANDTVFSEHVKLWEVKGVSFEGCTFLNQTSGLSGKGRGIYAHDAGIVLDVKCNGDGAMAVGLCGCLPEWSDSCVFNGFNTAVEVNTSGNPYAVTVNRARFRNNGTGVRINGNNFATVTRCDFDLTTNAQGLRYLYGLYLNGCLGFKVEANQYSGTVQYFNGITTGIHVNESGSSSNSLYKNLFNSLTYGVRTYGNNSGLKIQCNEFDSGGADIFVSPGSSISSSQGSLQTSAGNKFQQTYGMNISNGGIQSIKYYYKNSVTNSYAEPTLYSGSVYVTLSNDTNTCASTLCNNGGWIVNGTGPSLAQFQSSIAGTDDYSIPQGGANGNTAAWQALSDTYHAAVRTLMSDTVLNLNELELWHTAAQPIADPYSLTETRFMEGYAEPFIADADDAEMANYAEFHALKLALRDNGADNVGTVEANNYSPLQPDGHVNWYTLTPAQIAQLQTIAERNTGRASVMAKGVLCFFFGICYEDDLTAGVFEAGMDDSDTTGAPTKRAATSAGTNAALTVWPNPAGDLLHIELSGGGGIASVALYDLQGRVVTGAGAHAGTPQQDETATVNLRSVPAGVYLLRVRDAEGKEYMRKIVKK
ncbi:MAG: S8 family peptidase [Bacteroidales bacterium]|nr:S8 family peptidase [Bacteroidales bacterium]